MKLMKPLKKGFKRAVKVLTKIYGIEADIYFPLSVNNLKHGVRDNDITYNEEAELSAKVLIPAFFKDKVESDPLGSDFENDGYYLYYTLAEIPDYSKLVLKTPKNSIQNFQVVQFRGVSDDEQLIYGKYELIPLSKIDIAVNQEEFEVALEHKEDYLEDFADIPDNLLDMDGSKIREVEEFTPTVPNDKTYDPIS